MDLKDYLTNEKIRKRHGNQFDLVNYAIKLAENMIITGRDPRVKIESQNRSLQVLAEILQGKDYFDEIHVETEEAVFQNVDEDADKSEKSFDKSKSDRKKAKKSFAK